MSRPFTRRRRRPSNCRRPRFEDLEARRLMVSSIYFNEYSGIISIEGSDENHDCGHVEVQTNGTPTPVDDTIVVTLQHQPGAEAADCDSPGGFVMTEQYPLVYVHPISGGLAIIQSIYFDGLAGHDHFDNDTYLDSEAWGGEGRATTHSKAAAAKTFS